MLIRKNKLIIDSLERSKKSLSFYQKLKEIVEFLSNLVPVLGAVYAIVLVLFQYKYCQDAENFYNIDSIHFSTDNIQRLLLPLLLIIVYLICIVIFKCSLIKRRKINKDDVWNSLININVNIIASSVFMGGVFISLSGVIKIIYFFLGIIYIFIELICLVGCITNKSENKNENCKQKDLFTFILDILCLIILVLAGVFFFQYQIDNNRFFQTKKYEIINDVNTDFDSNKLDVDVVILHKGSQIITKKGKIIGRRLFLDRSSYELKDSTQYKYVLRNFEEGVSCITNYRILSLLELIDNIIPNNFFYWRKIFFCA